MDQEQYKIYHEKFMQNHNGTSAFDILLTIAPSIFTPWLANYFIVFLNLHNIFFKISVEFLMIILPVILSTTLLAELRYIWLVVVITLYLYVRMDSIVVDKIFDMKIDRRRKWNCISSCRALTGLLTAHCILAVDFKYFPRYFAKTEQFGYSLMDTGVGLYVFCNALVPTKVSRHSLIKSIEMNLKPCFILMMLGVLRTLIIKEIDYHEHITEYGLHWNFFITLAVTKLVSTILMSIFKENNSLICGILLLLVHEYLLQNYLIKWVFSKVGRYNFFTANREGLVSCLGYVALYLISVHIGQTLREKYKEKKEGHVIQSLLINVAFFWGLVYFTQAFFGTSRSLANMGYCCFIVAVGVSVLTIHYFIELVDLSLMTNKRKTHYENSNNMCKILSSVNNNGLFFFLFANICTGIVNLSIQTLLVNEVTAICVMFGYLVTIIGVTLILEYKIKQAK